MRELASVGLDWYKGCCVGKGRLAYSHRIVQLLGLIWYLGIRYRFYEDMRRMPETERVERGNIDLGSLPVILFF